MPYRRITKRRVDEVEGDEEGREGRNAIDLNAYDSITRRRRRKGKGEEEKGDKLSALPPTLNHPSVGTRDAWEGRKGGGRREEKEVYRALVFL